MRKDIFLSAFVLFISFLCSGQTTFINSTAPVGVGTASPGATSGAILDVQNTGGVAVQAQFGSTIPMYLIANHANLGFNTYYNGAWKYGAGSTNNYGGAIGFNHTDGSLRYWVSTNAGNAGDGINSHNYGFSVLHNGNFGIGVTNPNYKLHVDGRTWIENGLYTNNFLSAADYNYEDPESNIATGPSSTTKARIWSSVNNTGSANVFLQSRSFFGGGAGTPNTYVLFGDSKRVLSSIGNVTANGWAANASGELVFSTTPNISNTAVTERMRISSSGNVGIGTPNPEFNLDVNGTSRVKQLNIRNDGVGAKIVLHSSNGGDYNQIYANQESGFHLTFLGWKYFDLRTASGEELVFNPFQDVAWRLYQSNSTGAMTLWGYQGKGSFITKDVVSGKEGFRTYFSDGNFKHEFFNGNVHMGNNASPVDLLVNGNTITKKVKVTQTGWADYVFEPTYKLPTLQEVEAFIKQHKHLPDVPSAKEVERDGLDVGENQVVLLKKIEELTLYIIGMKKEIEELKKKVDNK